MSHDRDVSDPRRAYTKRVVVDATADVVAEQGLAGTTIDEIARVAGVARSTIYRNWPDTSSLLIETFESRCPTFEPTDGTGPLQTDLRAYGQRLAAALAGEGWGWLVGAVAAGSASDARMGDALVRVVRSQQYEVDELMSRACARGDLANPTPRGGELFVAPFYYRFLVSREPLDDAFVDAHVGGWLAAMT